MRLKQGHRVALPGTLALIALAALAVSACSGKGTEGICPESAACGGDPTGVWDSAGKCQFTANRQDQPLNPAELVQVPQLPVLTSSPIAPTTTGDWCNQLIYTPGEKVRSVNLWHDAPPLQSAAVSFNADKTYSATLNFSGDNVTHFTPYCLQGAGANPSCETLAQDLTTFYADKAGQDANGNKFPDFKDIACQLSSDNGCDCIYTYQVVLSDQGAWLTSGSQMSLSSAPNTYLLNAKPAGSQAPTGVMPTSFCQSEPQLTLSGEDGQWLFHVPGLRVLVLGRHI